MSYSMNVVGQRCLWIALSAVLLCLSCQPPPPPGPPSPPAGQGVGLKESDTTPTPSETGELNGGVQELREDAFKLQTERKWCDARQAWEAVKSRLSASPEHANLREEAEGNLRIVTKSCESKPIPETVKVVPGEDRPESVPEKDIVDFYPVGKTIRSRSYINITGSGTNKSWGLKAESKFAYQYRIAVETKVVENRGTAVVFRQDFQEVTQVRAVSRQTLELELPDSPILGMVWKEFEWAVLNPLPQYVTVKKIAEIGSSADPRLKKTLTSFQNLLKTYGVRLNDSDEVEYAVWLDRLAGCVVELEYVSGLGVTQIKLIKPSEGNGFDPDDLERLAHNSGLMMDYFLSRSETTPVGQPFRVQSRDVGALIRFGYDVRVEGGLELTKDKDLDKNKNSVLKVTGGEVTVRGNVEGIDRTGHLKPISGIVRYSPQERLVREARATWQADTSWITTEHLLFGTEKVSNLKLETYYEAQQVPSGEHGSSKEGSGTKP